MNATNLLAVTFAVLLVGSGAAVAAGSSYETGTESYAMDATLDDGTVTVAVDRGGSGVPDATVYADGERVGTTGENGTVSFETTAADELELAVEGDGFEMNGEFDVENGSLVLEKSEFERDDAEDEDADDEADDAEDDEGDHAREQNRTERADAGPNGDASASASASAERRGPSSELPDRASDRASSVRDVVRGFLSGDVTNLGGVLRDLLGGGAATA
ncbi:hypothetical protein ACFQJD_12845 [Haloplanus sp. GCM10025708]|uniref:hypothetical protein n=1 Tax=Haloferacaceae TaxID=1644056 RepID=UPI003623F6D6